MKLKQCLIVIGLLWPLAASAGGDSFFTGNRLFSDCNERSVSRTGYIAGLTDTLMMIDITMMST